MTPLLARMYREWANLDAAIRGGADASWIVPRRIRLGCLIVALEHRAAKRGAL